MEADTQQVIEAIERAPWVDADGVVVITVPDEAQGIIAESMTAMGRPPQATVIVLSDPTVEVSTLDVDAMRRAGWVPTDGWDDLAQLATDLWDRLPTSQRTTELADRLARLVPVEDTGPPVLPARPRPATP